MDEFNYSDDLNLGNGKHRQTIIYKGKEVGYLFSKEKNFLSPIEETYLIPDVGFGLTETSEGVLKGKLGWIEFKRFVDDYDTAFEYVRDNFDKVVYLFEVGDYD